MSLHNFIERVRAYGIRPENRRKITAQQMYPWAVERQFQQDLRSEFLKAGSFYEQQAMKNTWSFNDNMDDLTRSEYNNEYSLQPLAKRVEYEVEMFQRLCFENFTDTVIGARYIPTVVAPSLTETWEKNFLTLCKSTNEEMKKKISSVISDAVMNGNNIADTRKQIQSLVGTFSKAKANLIARTETAKLNMAISKAQMEEAGVEYYEWACILDERSRKSHAAMDGKICIWNNPNVVYDLKTHKTKPRPQSAVHLHPGDDYNCRCIALPWDELIEQELNQKKGKPNKQWLELKEQEKQKRAEQKAEREEIKRNKELVPKLYAENEALKQKIADLSREIELQRLEIEGLENSAASIEGIKEFTVYVINDEGEKIPVKKFAETMQDAKHAVYVEINKNPSKYGTNPVVRKFNEEKYLKKQVIKVDLSSIEEKTSAEIKVLSDDEARKIVDEKTAEIAEKIGLTRKSNKPTFEDINPNRDVYEKQNQSGNCQNCVAATWWSDHGYNAIACPKTKRWNPQNINDIWIDARTGLTPRKKFVHDIDELKQAGKDLPEGGKIQVYIFNKNRNAPGHTFSIQKDNGIVYIRDGQPTNPIYQTFDEYDYSQSTIEAQMSGELNGFQNWSFERDYDIAQYWRIDICYPSEEQMSEMIMPSKKK